MSVRKIFYFGEGSSRKWDRKWAEEHKKPV